MMDGYAIDALDVIGFEGPVPNAYWSIGSDTLMILLPGLGYTNQMPLMFYLHELARARQWDVLEVNYDYRRVPRETSAEEWAARMLGDVRPVIDAALARGAYRNVVLAGKSIGTRVMTTLLARGFDKATAFIWLTPLLVAGQVRDTVMDHAPSLAVFGDEDYAVKDVDLAAMARAGVTMIVMPGGDHSMMIEGDVPQSIAALAHVMTNIDAWIDRHVPPTGDNE
jgi:dienelactone hydrolase